MISYDDELLVVLHQLFYIFAKEGKGRVRHYDVCLFEQFDTLFAAEVAVSFEWFDTYFFGVGNVVAVLVSVVLQINGCFGLVVAKQVTFVVLIACGDEFF